MFFSLVMLMHRIISTASQKFSHPSHIYAIDSSICRYPANIADMKLDNVTLSSQCFMVDK